MNITFLSETVAWGGAEVHTVELAEILAKRGHQVHIVALGHGVFDEVARRPEAPFKLHRVPLAKPVKQLTWGECTALMRSLPKGVGVLVRWGLAVGSLRLDLAARWHFCRYLAIEHSAAEMPSRTPHPTLPPEEGGRKGGWGLWWYQGMLLWHLRSVLSHRLVCVSQAARRRMIRGYRVPRNKVVTVYNGIDSGKFQVDPERRCAARRQWGVPDNAFVFGSVSRLHPDKGLDLAVEGLSRLVRQHPQRDLRLVLVGDGPARESLQEAARALGVAERVVFAGFSARPWEAYPGLDCFLLPTHDEALSLSLIEAMACGCCSIAMGVGGVPEVLSDPRAGWLIPAEDRERFMAAMDAVVGLSAVERAAKGQAARALVSERFDAERQYAALADIIEQEG
jgi:glycosyltransferase involved in cell wall biosynthesis